MIWIEKNGTRRRGELAVCLCGKEFIRRANYARAQQFCSRNCSQESRKNRVIKSCYVCSRMFSRPASKLKSRSGLFFCGRKCKEQAQSIIGGVTEVQPSHYGVGAHADYRLLLTDDISSGCQVCRENWAHRITVHHIDGNRSNNSRDNLEVVCWNCHSTRHMKVVDGEWKYDGRSLTPREVVEKFDTEVKERIWGYSETGSH